MPPIRGHEGAGGRAAVTGSPPALVYLPGIHGDDSLAGGFRDRLGASVRWIPTRYAPVVVRNLEALVDDVLGQIRSAGVEAGWLLAESFGSQVAWALVDRCRRDPRSGFDPRGLILAGGFVRHPMPGLAGWLGRRGGAAPEAMVRRVLGAYRIYGTIHFAHDASRRRDLVRFCRRRARASDRAAVADRLGLIAATDLSPLAAVTRIPVHAVSGLLDVIVPWPPVFRWLSRNCPGWCGGHLVWGATHAVLVERPATAARWVRRWMCAEG